MSGDAANLAPATPPIAAAPAPIAPPPTLLYPPPPPGHAPLRVLLVAPRQVPAWMVEFARLAASDAWIEFAVLPVADARTPDVAGVAPDLRAYLAIDRSRARNAPTHDPLAPVAIADGDVACAPALGSGTAIDEICDAARALRPGLILLLGAPAWAEALGACAKWGCWRLDAGLVDPRHGGLDLLRPMLAGDSATALALELAHADGRVDALETSWGATANSFRLQSGRALSKLPALLLRALRRVAAGGASLPTRRDACLRLAPAPAGFAAGSRALLRASLRHVRKHLRKAGPEESWHLVVRRAPVPLDPERPVIGVHRALAPQRGQCWADPCLVEDAGRRLLFVEEFPEGVGKGVIVCLELDDKDDAHRLGIALEESFHLSYPQAFRWRGEWYLTVESGAAKRVSLYRAQEFPLLWTRVADLIVDRVCVDPTLYQHQGRWYLFANVSESGGSTWDELFLFVADSPLGPFHPHPANPIVSDVRCARSAGRLFHHHGRLIRPAQNCAPSYGAEVVFREIVELGETTHAERTLARLAPWMPGMDGCHTYTAITGLEVLDARERDRRGREKRWQAATGP
jgi:hypothetical protein